MDQLDIQTHTLSNPLANGANAVTIMQLGYASLTPMPPTVPNARLLTTPGHGGLMAPQVPTDPSASKAVVEWCNGFGVVLGVIDQTTVLPFTPLPGDSWTVSTLSPSTYVWCSSTGLVLSSAADISLLTATHKTTVNALITVINALVGQQNALLQVLQTLTVDPSTGLVNPATVAALQANAQTIPQVIP